MDTTSAKRKLPLRRRAALWIVAVRAYAYPASIVPVLLGSVYAWYGGTAFLPAHLVLALLAGMLYHTGCNLLNDYYDYRYGVDREGAFGGSGVLTGGLMTPRQIMLGACACLTAGSLIGFYFVFRYGIPILVLGGAGLLGAVFYTATPCGLKYHALGEPLVFLTMGVGMVLGGAATQGAPLGWRAAAVSLPVAFLVAAILQANDARDIAGDRASGVKTLSVLLGPRGARLFLYFLVDAAYVSLAALAAGGIVPPWALLAFGSMPQARRLCARFREYPGEAEERLAGAAQGAALLHLSFGLLMAAGIAVGGRLR